MNDVTKILRSRTQHLQQVFCRIYHTCPLCSNKWKMGYMGRLEFMFSDMWWWNKDPSPSNGGLDCPGQNNKSGSVLRHNVQVFVKIVCVFINYTFELGKFCVIKIYLIMLLAEGSVMQTFTSLFIFPNLLAVLEEGNQ